MFLFSDMMFTSLCRDVVDASADREMDRQVAGDGEYPGGNRTSIFFALFMGLLCDCFEDKCNYD